MSMTEDDWEKFLHERPEDEEYDEQEEQEPNKIKYRNRLKVTAKAEFYATGKNEDGGVPGFWVPKTAIIRVHQGYVYTEHWFEPKEIIYYDY